MSRAATFLLRVALMTACLLPRTSVLAAEAPPPEAQSLEHMHHTAWTERDGAPGNAFGLAQTPDGTLWIGSPRGLFRFDGVRFELYTAPDTGRPLTDEVFRLYAGRSGELWAVSIEADPAGHIWLGYLDNRLARVERGHARMLGPSEGLQVGNVSALRPWGERLWVGGNAGVALYAQGRFHALMPASGPALRGVSGLAQTAGGELWIHGAGGAVRVPREEVEAFARDPAHAVQVERFTADDGLEGSPEPLSPIPSLRLCGGGKAQASVVALRRGVNGSPRAHA